MRLPESPSHAPSSSRFMGSSPPDADTLRRMHGVTPADRGTPATPNGCYLIGTSCTAFVQTCHYKCSTGCITQGCGWCVGFWGAPPCI
jgi:hypothetical protein